MVKRKKRKVWKPLIPKVPFPVHPDFWVNPEKKAFNYKERLRRIRAKREKRALELRAQDKKDK